MTPTTDEPAAPPRARWEKWAVLFLLLSAVTLRVLTVGTYDLWLDEFWTIELSTGRGSVHLDIPHNVVLDEPPRTTQLDGAPPWWTVWTSMERVTHPPLYFLLLRGWRETFGEGDLAARLLSVAASAVSLLFLWDIARRMIGPAAAFWTCALFAVAWPQIEYAQQVRNYAVLTALALGMLWAVVRMRRETTSDTTVANDDGWTWTNGIVLFAATLGTLLTHYFAAGTVAAMFLAVILCLRGRTRRLAASTMVLAGVAFLATWGPWMWEQRHVFRTTDPTTAFLVDAQPGRAWRTVARLVLQPGLLVAPLTGHWKWLALAGAVAWIWPLSSHERRSRLLPTWLWMTGTIAVIALLDFTRGTMHLEFPRYTLLAGPGAYLLIAAAGTSSTSPKWRPVGHVLLTAIVAGGLTATLNVEREWRDYRSLVAKVKEQTSSGDVIVFASPHYPDEWAVGALYLGFDHYSGATNRPVLLLRGNLPGELEQRLRRAPRIWLVLEMKVQERPETVLRGFTPVEGHFIYGFPAELWLMR